MRSRERNEALKLAGRKCHRCGVKQSQAKGREQKLEVHHPGGINWDLIIEIIRRHILLDAHRLEVLCPECHLEHHHGGPESEDEDFWMT